MDYPTAHALLRSRRDWCGTPAALEADADGNLRLARVPGPSDGRAVDGGAAPPYVRQASGIAAGPCDAVFVADTAHHRILYVDGLCGTRSELPRAGTADDLPGHFDTPRGLAVSRDGLLVADSGNDRVQQLAFPRLEAHLALPGLPAVASVAVDSRARVLVVDATGTRRLLPGSIADTAFGLALLAAGVLVRPLFVAVGADDHVLLADTAVDEVFVFDAQGRLVDTLAGPDGWMPGALACDGARRYVADAASGMILVFDGAAVIGTVAGWRGPVTALAVDADGGLLIKPDLGATWFRFAADLAYVPQGSLLAGPFDAGEARAWDRAWIQADTPAGTQVIVEVALQAAATPAPIAWHALPCADALLAPLAPTGLERRFVWLRVTLTSSDPGASPVLRQARAATAAEDWLDYLPATFRRHDQTGLLSRWLSELRGEFGAVEEALDDMARVADPSFAANSTLPWLAQWLALELPRIATADERRGLIDDAVMLFARRGTKESIAGFVQRHTGIRPAIVEEFESRAVWVLGQTSRLGFDTRLPALAPFGMVLPDEEVADPCCPGPIGSAIVGASGPLASYQAGVPLFAETAWRFCVVVDAYRADDPATLQELRRIVDREKPAHTDYRVRLVQPDMRVGLQSVVGVDTIVGGEPPAWRLAPATLSVDTRLPPTDVARVGDARIDGTLILN
ncbi:MAG: phage tail protein [Burkholderiaceae bacterium]